MSIALFADVANLYPAVKARYQAKVDYGKVVNAYTDISRQFAYGSQVGNEASNFITALRHLNYLTKFKKLRTGENWNVEIALDVVRLADRFNTIIVMSNDTALVPLYKWCHERGMYVCVIACEHEDELREHVNLLVPLNENFIEG
jgi:uncharacterized LabA/DUF88 family protein